MIQIHEKARKVNRLETLIGIVLGAIGAAGSTGLAQESTVQKSEGLTKDQSWAAQRTRDMELHLG